MLKLERGLIEAENCIQGSHAKFAYVVKFSQVLRFKSRLISEPLCFIESAVLFNGIQVQPAMD